MARLSDSDQELVERAKETILDRYVEGSTLHTVGCALRCKSGKVYTGINMDGIHSICAEQVAISCAYMAKDCDIDTIVAVGYFKGNMTMLTPCGNCRQFLSVYAPNCSVIIENGKRLAKVSLDELLPYKYVCHVD